MDVIIHSLIRLLDIVIILLYIIFHLVYTIKTWNKWSGRGTGTQLKRYYQGLIPYFLIAIIARLLVCCLMDLTN